MSYIKLFEEFNEGYNIIDDGNGTITLLYKNMKVGRLNTQVTELRLSSDIDYVKYYKVSFIEIDDIHRGKGYSVKMYKYLIDNAPSDIKGIISHEADRSNKIQVPKIYKKFNSYYEDGWYVIPINIPESIVIDESLGDGTGNVSGVIHYNRNYLNNWLESNGVDLTDIETLKMPIGILKNINVDEDNRNNGIGNDLLSEFENLCAYNNCKLIILISDMYESQLDGFNLDKWYINNGYTEIIETDGGKLFQKKL